MMEPLDVEISQCVGCARAARLLGKHFYCFTHQLAVYKRARKAAERLENEQETGRLKTHE
jgi:hypothetical protein